MTRTERELLQVSLPHQGPARGAGRPLGLDPSAPSAPGSAHGAAAEQRPEGRARIACDGQRRCLRRGIGRHRDGGGAIADRGSVEGVRGVLPSRPPSTQAEPSRRGPGRPGRSYSGALHLDALNHARSTVCGSTADGMGAGEGGGACESACAAPVSARVNSALRSAGRSEQSDVGAR